MRRVLMILLLLPAVCYSQTTKPRFHSFLSPGMVAGQTGVKPVFQLTGGIAYGRHFTGVGVGYDQYKFNTIPVFADWRFNFGKNDIFFTYVDGGYNFTTKYKREEEWGKVSDRIRGGFYMDLGLGMRAQVGGSHRVFLSAGYSRKNAVVKKAFTNCWGPCPVAEPPTVYTYKYEFGRIVIRAGWEFGR